MRVVILGAGGHGRVMAEAARLTGLAPIGFLDDSQQLSGTSQLGIPVLGTIALLERGEIPNVGALLGIGGNPIRLALARRLKPIGVALPTVVHPHGWVSPSAVVGIGTVIMANASVQTGCRVGDAVIINTNASIDHDCVLADGVHVSPGAHLAGNVSIGEGTHIGIGATIIEDIHIGANCVVAAGAVVIRDVPDGERVAGVPARPMHKQEQR